MEPGPPHPHVTQEIHLVLSVKRDLMLGPGFPDSSPTPAIAADPHERPQYDSAVTTQAGTMRSATHHRQAA